MPSTKMYLCENTLAKCPKIRYNINMVYISRGVK